MEYSTLEAKTTSCACVVISIMDEEEGGRYSQACTNADMLFQDQTCNYKTCSQCRLLVGRGISWMLFNENIWLPAYKPFVSAERTAQRKNDEGPQPYCLLRRTQQYSWWENLDAIMISAGIQPPSSTSGRQTVENGEPKLGSRSRGFLLMAGHESMTLLDPVTCELH